MTDVFDEVEESLRTERYRSAFSRAWPWLAALLVLAVLAFGGWWAWREWRERQALSASEFYQTATDAAGRGQRPAAVTAFSRAADAGSPGYRTLALMHQGALRAGQNDLAGALEFYDRAADAAPTPILGDAAALQAVFTAMDRNAPIADLERRLTPLTAEGRPYRPLAREALAIARLAAGRTAEARREFVVLSLLEDSPESLRARAEAAVQLIDSGTASAVPAIVRAAAAMPSTPAAAAGPPLPTQPLPPAAPAPAAPAPPALAPGGAQP